MVTVEFSVHDGQGFICIEHRQDLTPEDITLRQCSRCGEAWIEKTRLAMTEKDARKLRDILNNFLK